MDLALSCRVNIRFSWVVLKKLEGRHCDPKDPANGFPDVLHLSSFLSLLVAYSYTISILYMAYIYMYLSICMRVCTYACVYVYIYNVISFVP